MERKFEHVFKFDVSFERGCNFWNVNEMPYFVRMGIFFLFHETKEILEMELLIGFQGLSK